MTRLAEILARAGRLPFVALVTQLAQELGAHAAIGADGPYDSEAVRFRHDPSLGFRSADVSDGRVFESGSKAAWVELTTSFAGLTGTASPLPPSFIERFCRDDERDEHGAQAALLDLFHHRLLSLFYRGLLKYDVPRSTRRACTGRALDWVLLLAGLAPQHASRVTGLSRAQLLTLAPLLVTYPPNATRLAIALRTLLHDLLGDAEVRVVELRGRFVLLEPSARARLGVDLVLRQTSTLGRRAPAPASDIVVQLDPLAPAVLARLSPGGDRHDELDAVTQLFCPETVQVVIELTPTHTPPARLGTSDNRLGRGAWLRSRTRPATLRFVFDPSRGRKHQHAN